MKIKLSTLTACLALSGFISTAALADDRSEVEGMPTQFRITYDQVNMPGGASTMGLLGIHSLISTPSGLYGGLVGYGGVQGSQGGLLGLGLETGWEYEIFNKIIFDAGISAAGVGGDASSVGGGLLMNYHTGLMYDFGYFKLGPHYSYITAPSGGIRSTRIGLTAETTSFFSYINPDKYGQVLSLPSSWITHNYFALYTQDTLQRSGTKDVDGNVQDGSFQSAGFELGHYVTDNAYISLKTAGAYSGIPSGYMEVLGGAGYRLPLFSHFSATGAMYIGAGGGGKVDTGGGLLLQPTAGLQWNMTNDWGLWGEGGYVYSPKGQLRAPTATLKLYRAFDGTNKDHGDGPLTNYTINKWRVRVMNQTYVDPKRTSGASGNINLANVTFDQFLSPMFYLTGQASSAYAGRGQTTGGPATGLVGVGAQTDTYLNHWALFGEGLIGASGGGGYDTGGGAVAEPVVGINYAFNSKVALQGSYGRMFALKKHQTDNSVYNAGLVFSFGAPGSPA